MAEGRRVSISTEHWPDPRMMLQWIWTSCRALWRAVFVVSGLFARLSVSYMIVRPQSGCLSVEGGRCVGLVMLTRRIEATSLALWNCQSVGIWLIQSWLRRTCIVTVHAGFCNAWVIWLQVCAGIRIIYTYIYIYVHVYIHVCTALDGSAIVVVCASCSSHVHQPLVFFANPFASWLVATLGAVACLCCAMLPVSWCLVFVVRLCHSSVALPLSYHVAPVMLLCISNAALHQ